jgi:hypothetical protein
MYTRKYHERQADIRTVRIMDFSGIQSMEHVDIKSVGNYFWPELNEQR